MAGSAVWPPRPERAEPHSIGRTCLAPHDRAFGRLTVLVVDDDPDVVRALAAGVRGQPVDLAFCAEPAEALLLVGRTCPDAVLLGPVSGRLAALDPLDFIAVVRAADPRLPVLVGVDATSGALAARAAAAGVNVVLPRPYRVAELLGVLRSVALASGAFGAPGAPGSPGSRWPPIDLGRLRVDGTGPQIWLDGRRQTLPLKEYLLLRYFAEHEGAVLARQELLDAVWPDADGAGAGHGAGSGARAAARSNTLTVHIMRLRRRLGDTERGQRWISSLRGVGYRFAIPTPE